MTADSRPGMAGYLARRLPPNASPRQRAALLLAQARRVESMALVSTDRDLAEREWRWAGQARTVAAALCGGETPVVHILLVDEMPRDLDLEDLAAQMAQLQLAVRAGRDMSIGPAAWGGS